jgi:hydrogenase maturation protease
MSSAILVAGIGNIFLGDDAFGVEVVRALVLHGLPTEVTVKDIGIRFFSSPIPCSTRGTP